MHTSLLTSALALSLIAGTAFGQAGPQPPGAGIPAPRTDNPANPTTTEGMNPRPGMGRPGMDGPGVDGKGMDRDLPEGGKAPQPVTQTFGSLDKNGDGHISNSEFGANNTLGQFKSLDTNGDGKISDAEFRSYDSKLTP